MMTKVVKQPNVSLVVMAQKKKIGEGMEMEMEMLKE
jgi:hypothetical protein